MLGPAKAASGGVLFAAQRKRRLGDTVALGGGAMVVASLVLLSSARLRRADVRLGDLLRRGRSSGRADLAVAAATDLGSMYGVLGVASALGLAGRRRLARDVFLVGSTAWSVAQAAKTRVKRERPYDAEGVVRLIRPPTGSSYPSGHAAVTAATMSVVATHGDRPVRAVARALMLFVGASRIYVGVHYPSDVLGGAGLGLLIARVWRAMTRNRRP